MFAAVHQKNQRAKSDNKTRFKSLKKKKKKKLGWRWISVARESKGDIALTIAEESKLG